VVVAASRWQDLRQNVRDMLTTRIELALSTPAESMVSGRIAALVPKGRPGRGLAADGSHLLAGLPHLGQPAVPTDELVKGIASQWSGPPAPPVRLLPREVPHASLPAPHGLFIPIGIAESDMQPVAFDFAAEPNLLVYGDAECGKSAFLRALATSIVGGNAPELARVAIIDYRRTLLGTITTEHQIGYCSTPDAATELVESIANYMRVRQPGPDVTADQIRNRSWWSGPECFILVDDYDMVATGAPNPLSAIVEFLPQARDLGLHVVIARRAAGANRSGDAVTARLRDLSTAVLIMSGDPTEGAIIGTTRPVPLPPGRGRLLTRRSGAPALIQLGHRPL
jgi:S-DNA-T family DNA segregation ATPase FtsK/SpoIIIE